MNVININYLKSVMIVLVLALASCGSAKKTGDDLVADAREEKAMIEREYPMMADHFNEAAGYAIFPNVGKGAYIIGGASGNGAVYENGNLIGYADLKQVDVGLQIGGKAFVEVLFFETEEDLQQFKDGSYQLDASASAVILDKGISKNLDFENGVAVVTVPKGGAMAGISVGGQRFDFNPIQ
ncbi:lipid-binding SYLF domain-containing protein [Salinimicrobium terrae]|uniref:lipid-binding SYLF domain-containing protein n=1 Tax=Salinimicrobium terrae TaxID=470866 RepID=UPI0004915969|nr:lipid-binding SYLF domain-containing protein [Salinimicrobium terrae]